MRYIIYGAGAIGGTIGARLFQQGQDVVLIARGDHLAAIQQKGLTFRSPVETESLPIPCVGHPSEIDFRPDDIVFMTVKTHQSQVALEALRDAAGDEIPVVCCQNSVANERMALRLFQHVYAMVVMLPASHLEPGVVQTEAVGITGILDAGCYPSGTDELIEGITRTLSNSNFTSQADPKVMRQKYAKLLNNLNNALDALTEARDEAQDISRMLNREALACYEAAGIDCASREEVAKRRGNIVQTAPVSGQPRGGSSSWQSVARGTGSIEADYLNGEIVLLGRLYGVPTPANLVLQRLANRLAKERGKTGSYSVDQVRRLIVEAGGVF